MAEGFDKPMYEDDYDKEVDDEFGDETQLLLNFPPYQMGQLTFTETIKL